MNSNRGETPKSRIVLHWLALGLITLFAGVVRFTHLDHPCLWYDEAMVFWRTCGSYAQLLDCLRTDGFVPLHYSLIWLITRGFPATPATLRFVPAMCGTLMAPAVYFLSRQMLPRNTSLLAAAFAACSAFALFYSRDAKMYMDAWLFVALNIACALWWFRRAGWTAWLCWVASGCAACGLHISAAIPVALSSLLLFTQDKMRWQQTLVWLFGVAIILSGPIGHYEKFNTWMERADENWNESGLQWVKVYNYGRSGPELVRFLATTFAMGWEWPKPYDIARMQPERFDGPATCAKILLWFLIAACLPWPRRWRGACDDPQTPALRYSEEPDRSVEAAFEKAPNGPGPSAKIFHHGGTEYTEKKGRETDKNGDEPEEASIFLRALRASVVNTSRLEPESSVPHAPQPQWRVLLWLSILILLPVYGFYCRSMTDFSGPVDWWHWLTAQGSVLKSLWWLWLLILALAAVRIYLIAIGQKPRGIMIRLGVSTARVLAVIAVGAGLLAICWLIAAVMTAQAKAAADAGKPWESLWVPRYIGFVWPVFAVAVAGMIMRLPTRAVRFAVILFVLGVNLAVASVRIVGETEPPVDLMARDVVDARDSSRRLLVRTDLHSGTQNPGGGNLLSGPGEYYLDLLGKVRTDPPTFKKSSFALEQEGRSGFYGRGPVEIPAEIDRIVVWEQSAPAVHRGETQLRFRLDGERLLNRLRGWRLAGEQTWIARDCWIWQDLALYRRREFVRVK